MCSVDIEVLPSNEKNPFVLFSQIHFRTWTVQRRWREAIVVRSRIQLQFFWFQEWAINLMNSPISKGSPNHTMQHYLKLPSSTPLKFTLSNIISACKKPQIHLYETELHISSNFAGSCVLKIGELLRCGGNIARKKKSIALEAQIKSSMLSNHHIATRRFVNPQDTLHQLESV